MAKVVEVVTGTVVVDDSTGTVVVVVDAWASSALAQMVVFMSGEGRATFIEMAGESGLGDCQSLTGEGTPLSREMTDGDLRRSRGNCEARNTRRDKEKADGCETGSDAAGRAHWIHL